MDYKFLIVGHTYCPADRYFGIIERHVRKLENVYTPQQWYQHVQKSSLITSSKIEVVEVTQSEFYKYWSYLHNFYAERKKDIDGCDVEFSKVTWFNFGVGEEMVNRCMKEEKHPHEVWIRYTHDISEKPKKVSFQKLSNVRYTQLLPQQLYDSNPLSIKAAKAADLKKLANDFCPSLQGVCIFYKNKEEVGMTKL